MRDSLFKVARHVTISVLGLAATLWKLRRNSQSREGQLARPLINDVSCEHSPNWRQCLRCNGLGRPN